MVSASEPKSPRPMGEGGAAIAAGVRSEQLPRLNRKCYKSLNCNIIPSAFCVDLYQKLK